MITTFILTDIFHSILYLYTTNIFHITKKIFHTILCCHTIYFNFVENILSLGLGDAKILKQQIKLQYNNLYNNIQEYSKNDELLLDCRTTKWFRLRTEDD